MSDNKDKNRISSQVLSLTNQAKMIMQADHCLLVFINELGEALFYHFDSCQLYALEVQETILEDLLREDIPSITFPMKLGS